MVLSPPDMALIGSLLLSVLAFGIALKSLASSRQQQRQAEKLFQRLAHELSVSSSGNVGMGQRLLAMEKRLQSASPSNQKIDYANDENFQPYSQAAQLFSLGIDSEEVARRCGLSRAEASLIQMMQANASHVD
jgi:hypothetical protein